MALPAVGTLTSADVKNLINRMNQTSNRVGLGTILDNMSSGGEANTASNLAGGQGLFSAKVGVDLRFKSLVAGTNITLTPAANTITIDAAGGGETNTASNLGAGSGVFAAKVGVDLQFKSLVAGTNITLTPSGTEILIDAAGGAGATTALDNLGVTAINASLLFDTDVTYDIGSGTEQVNNIYVATVVSPSIASPGSLTLASSGFLNTATLVLGPGASITSSNTIKPDADLTHNLGASSAKWLEVYTQTVTSGGGSNLFVDGDTGLTLKSSSASITIDVPTAGLNASFNSFTTAWTGAAVGLMSINASPSDPFTFGTIDALTDATKDLLIISGAITDSSVNSTGDIETTSGQISHAASTGNTGQIYNATGDHNGASGNSGDITQLTGSAPTNSGELLLLTGSAGANSGRIRLDTGNAVGVRGNVEIDSGILDITAIMKTNAAERHFTRTDATATITVDAAADWFIAASGTDTTAVLVNLPAGVDGQEFVIKDTDGNALVNNITIDPNGAETIDEAATLVLNTNFASAHIVFVTGLGWQVIN